MKNQLKALAYPRNAPIKKKENKQPTHSLQGKRQDTPEIELCINLTICFIPRKHCQSGKAGLLTCNIFAVLPIPIAGDSGLRGRKPFSLLTVAGQLVICTQFPINPGTTRGPLPFDEGKRKNFILRRKLRFFRPFLWK